jgi:hypothetical protein
MADPMNMNPDTMYRSRVSTGRGGFLWLLRSEWTKFRTVRGWVLGMAAAGAVTVLLGLLVASSAQFSCGDQACAALPVGPGGEAVVDRFSFVHQPLDGDGSISVRVSSLTGLFADRLIQPGQGLSGMHPGLDAWAKAGLIIKGGTGQGSPYVAIMVTGGHGVRMQDDYTHDTPGPPGTVSAAAPRWLRLTRAGATITGSASADGRSWTTVGTVTVPGLPSTAQVGLFVTSPSTSHITSQGLGAMASTGGPALATAVFDQLSLQGTVPGTAWTSDVVGGTAGGLPASAEAFHEAGGVFTVSGSGDIAPDVPGVAADRGVTIDFTLVGVFAGLIAVSVVASMFVTAEYRGGLIRTTFAANPPRVRVLIAKAIVVGAVTFVAGLAAVTAAVALNSRILRDHGASILPSAPATEIRVVVGTAALLAVAAVFALAVGTLTRRGSGAVTTVIAVIVLPYLLATTFLPTGAANRLLRLTPAAAFAVQQTVPEYPQVDGDYSPFQGYFPLAPWTGFAVLCAWTAAALALAAVMLRRRDA